MRNVDPADLRTTSEVAEQLCMNRTSILHWKRRYPSIGLMVGSRFKIPQQHIDLIKSGVSVEQVAAASLFDFGSRQLDPPVVATSDGAVEYSLLEKPAPEADPMPVAASNSEPSPPDPDAPFADVDIDSVCERAAITWQLCRVAVSPRAFDLVADLLIDLLVELKLLSPHDPDAAMGRYVESRNIRSRAMKLMTRRLES
jgi:hypothetical protein